jgi:opacity protein-like surface antigen
MLLATVVMALPAAAQSEWELYAGTSFLWAKTSPNLQQLNLSTLHEFGWQTDIPQYPWRWFGGTLEASGFYGRPNIYVPANYFGPGLPSTNRTYSDYLNVKSYTIMFGPTFAYRRNPRFQPFGHVLMGGIERQYSPTSKADPGEISTGYTPNYSKWIFGWALGGGADVSVNSLVAFRGQFDWIPSTFHNVYNDRQNNLRISFGLVFRFGGEQPTKAGLKPDQPSQTSTQADNVPAEPQSPTSQHSLAAASAPNTPPIVRTAPSATAQQRLEPSPQPGGASGSEPIAPAPIASVPVPAPQVMVEFWSRPTGADVEIDGQYVGSTLSTIPLAPGEHTIAIRMKDFAPWQKTITVTSGNVRVAAYLEQTRATVTFH